MDILINNQIIKIFPNAAALLQAALANFVLRAQAAIAEKGEFKVVLSGGKTGSNFFYYLQKEKDLPWNKIKIFFADERYVPSTDKESNYHAAKEHLFSKIAIPAENIYRIPTELSPEQAAASYAEKLTCFDLTYLGLGEDAHTASLMPYTKLVMDSTKMAASVWVPHLKMYRITLTPFAINQSQAICFLVTGSNKAKALHDTLQGGFNPHQYPAQLIEGRNEKIRWYVDEAAADMLNQ